MARYCLRVSGSWLHCFPVLPLNGRLADAGMHEDIRNRNPVQAIRYFITPGPCDLNADGAGIEPTSKGFT
jgi:hypothetical protein